MEYICEFQVISLNKRLAHQALRSYDKYFFLLLFLQHLIGQKVNLIYLENNEQIISCPKSCQSKIQNIWLQLISHLNIKLSQLQQIGHFS